ncbi:sodium/dicarboxylate or sulfate cotransporter [Methanothermobacter thermautotrophicus str. Delta H]|uniref:Sodium/dicarboxylate or sulfate cotransporter n=1 Tax=Methanothermobacter thermautotrophicus (strain ATCC 29096 / DSM 1053 / JCM 10044 / NBRC 100330 / Delta H) TaxID=187420 RepID=O26881_METTH|nr:sodium/dicarboxylate or sulfate cotransporter [Methanothermobacter thermautotrophicus str. Delta H]
MALAVYLVPLPGLRASGHAALALLVFAVTMWATEAVPLAVTSLIILFAQPLIGVESFENAVIGFANPILFLMIGGFIMAEAIRKSGLAQRFTYYLLGRLGTSPERGLFVSIFSTGLLSAWIENVVAFAMLLPIIKEIVDIMGCSEPEKGKSNYAKAMILGASFGSLAGGFGTEIGTAPNLMAAAYTSIPFLNWMIFGLPLSIAMLLVTWFLLMRIFPSEVRALENGDALIGERIRMMGSMSRDEKLSAGILLFAILLWVTAGFTGINSYSVSLIAAVMFIFAGVITWKDAQKNIDWGLVVFFGGALSLGSALLKTGAAAWIIDKLVGMLGSDPSTVIVMLVLMAVAVIITQVMSNIALSAILVPLSVTLASAQHQPIGVYAVPVAIACSLSFMLPMADPTVAMAYGSGYVKLRDIPRAGIPIIAVGIILTVLVITTLAAPFIS